MDSIESEATSTSLLPTQDKRLRKSTSRCWESFEMLPIGYDGKSYAKCRVVKNFSTCLLMELGILSIIMILVKV